MKLTITLTLKGREPFTYRWMQYMNEMRCPYKILIADGGDDPVLEEHLRQPDSYPNLDYEYIRYPFDASLDDFYRKLENVISRVRTEYILQADNDDFYLLDRIPEIIAFLDNNSDYVAARGQLVNFEVFNSSGSSKGQVQGAYYKAIPVEAPSLDGDCALQRTENLCHDMSKYDYYSNWYSIVSTHVLQGIWRDLITLPIKEVIVLEILSHVMLVNKGKLKVFPHPFYLRQANTSVFGDTLVVGNEFLERCIVNNAFSEFVMAIDQFIKPASIDGRKRILSAIAGWLETFVVNIHRARQRRLSFTYRLAALIRRVPVFGYWVEAAYISLAHLAFPARKGQRLRIKEIEPFALVSK